jgi:DNA processing protein
MPAYFVQRNEIIAALTAATVVVEAGIESGARSTAAAARRHGRPLFVVPHAPWDPRGAGCLLEIARGARPIASAADIIAVVGAPPPERKPTPRAALRADPLVRDEGDGERGAPILDQEQRTVLDVLRRGPAHIDEVCEKSGLSSRAVARALLTLTLHAVVVEGPAGSYRRAH